MFVPETEARHYGCFDRQSSRMSPDGVLEVPIWRLSFTGPTPALSWHDWADFYQSCPGCTHDFGCDSSTTLCRMVHPELADDDDAPNPKRRKMNHDDDDDEKEDDSDEKEDDVDGGKRDAGKGHFLPTKKAEAKDEP